MINLMIYIIYTYIHHNTEMNRYICVCLHKGLGKTPRKHGAGMSPEGTHSSEQVETEAADGHR